MAVLLVASMAGLPAPALAEERVDHGDDGFTIRDNGTFAAPVGNVQSLDVRTENQLVGEGANTGNHKAYDFIVDPPADKDARYDITVEYDRQVAVQDPSGIGPTVCAAELHMELTDENGGVADEETRDCIDDTRIAGLGLDPGA